MNKPTLLKRTHSPSDSFLPLASYQQAMGKMRYLLPALALLVAGLSLWDRSADRQFFLWINTGIPRALPEWLLPMWDATMITLTDLGDVHVMLWIILLIQLPWWMREGRKTPETLSLYWVAFAVVLLLAAVISLSLKEMVGALRPAGILPPESLHILGKTLIYYAFPSGHTVTAFAGACVLLPIIRASWGWGALTLAAAIGLSRIGVGAHWPIDIVAGAFVGIVAGMLGWQMAFWLQKKGLAEHTLWKNVYQSLALLGLLIMTMNVAYTPFYELEHRSVRLGLIALCLTSALLWGYFRRGKSAQDYSP